jgi:hypothetical protein
VEYEQTRGNVKERVQRQGLSEEKQQELRKLGKRANEIKKQGASEEAEQYSGSDLLSC